VQRGDVWQCGRHVFVCGTLLELSHISADVFYCDPPWNNAITSTFRRNAGYGDEAGASWQDIYEGIIRLAAGRPLFIEGGEKQADEVQAMLSRTSGLIVRQWPITYSRATRPCVLHYAGPPNGAAYGDPSGLDDADTPSWVMGRLSTGLVADLTAGRGITSRCAEESGWASFSVELDSRRVSAALIRMAKLTGKAPGLAEPAQRASS
jgi:hypothetical protein